MKRPILALLLALACAAPSVVNAALVVTGHVRSIGERADGHAGVPLLVVGTVDTDGSPARLTVEVTDETRFVDGSRLEDLRPGQPVRVTVSPADGGEFLIFWKVDALQRVEGTMAQDLVLMLGAVPGAVADGSHPLLAKAAELVSTKPLVKGFLGFGSKTECLVWVRLPEVPSFEAEGFTRLDHLRIQRTWRRSSRIDRVLGGTHTKETRSFAHTAEFRDDAVTRVFDELALFERDWQSASQEQFGEIFGHVTSTEAATLREKSFVVTFEMTVLYRDEKDGSWKELRPGFVAESEPKQVEGTR